MAGRHMLRLLRRAEALSWQSGGSAACGGGESSATVSETVSSGSEASVLQAELQLVHRGLQPCGGPLYVQLTAAPQLLGGGSGTGDCTCARPEQQAAAGAAAAQPQSGQSAAGAAGPYQGHVPAAVAAAQVMLTCHAWLDGHSSHGASGTDTCEVLHAVLKAAEGAAQHAKQAPLQPFRAPPAGSSLKAHQFMRLEPLEPGSAQQAATPSRLQGPRQRPLAAVLHAHKAAQHLVLRFSCEAAPCGACTDTAGSGGGGTCGRLSCCAHVARCMRGFCAGENASVVAVDAQLHPGRHDSTWLLFVAGLQHRDRADLATALDRHFA